MEIELLKIKESLELSLKLVNEQLESLSSELYYLPSDFYYIIVSKDPTDNLYFYQDSFTNIYKLKKEFRRLLDLDSDDAFYVLTNDKDLIMEEEMRYYKYTSKIDLATLDKLESNCTQFQDLCNSIITLNKTN